MTRQKKAFELAMFAPFSTQYQNRSCHLFVSGQLPIDPATGVMPEDIKDQARASLKNVKAVLEAAGTSLDNVLKTTCFLADIQYFAAFNEVYSEFFPGAGAPARSAVGIAALPKGAKVEIEAIAVR